MIIATKTRKTRSALNNVKVHTNRGASHPAKTFSIQPKLTISKPNDKYDQEADRVADKVVSMPAPAKVQRKCSTCEAEDKQMQRKPLAASITPLVQRQEEEKEEPQAKLIQRQEEKKEEPQAKLLQRQEEEKEEPQAKLIQKQEEEKEEPQAKLIQKQEEEKEEPQAKLLQRQEEDLPTVASAKAGKEEPQAKLLQRQPLCKGCKGKAVQTVQKALISSGHYICKDGADGNFGPKTEQVVKNVKKKQGLKPDGKVDRKTFSSIVQEQSLDQKQGDPEAEQSSLQDKDEEPPVMTKRFSPEATKASNSLESRISSSKSGGSPLSDDTRSFMESRIGADFSNVKVHTDSNAVQMSQELSAQAFTHSNHIYFNSGKYNPSSNQGKHLLAHELTHTVQQNNGNSITQRVRKDWRYTPPAKVIRSIIEIQGIVGTTPDGIYGPKTKAAVEKYQQQLLSKGLYTSTIDGKWGEKTDIAHESYATGPNAHRRGYNCAGFALKKFIWIDMVPAKAILSGMTKLADCSKKCKPWHHKFFFWDFDISTTNLMTGITSPTWRDFHMVGGQTNGKGKGPGKVMSKDGPRPIVGPKPPLDWRPITEPVIDQDGNVVPHLRWNVSGGTQECFCNDKLP